MLAAPEAKIVNASGENGAPTGEYEHGGMKMPDRAAQAQAESQALKAQVDFFNKVWTDGAFRTRLDRDPKSVLAEFGAQLPDGVEIKVIQDTDKVKYLHIPSPPPEGEITDADLEASQGGSTPGCYAASLFTAAALSAGISAPISYATENA